MATLPIEAFEKLEQLESRYPRRALKLLDKYERDYPGDFNLEQNKGAFLIDIGSALKDIAIVQRGIKSIEELQKVNNDKLNPVQWYNLGNGHYALESIAREQPNNNFDPINTPLIAAKHCYRQAMRDMAKRDPHWRAQLHTNYALCLAELGRSVESIRQYNLALQDSPQHPMAWGNLGAELRLFAYVSPHPAPLLDALHALNEALKDDRLERIGHFQDRSLFEKEKQLVERDLRKVGEIKLGKHKTPPVKSKHHRAFVDFCLEHELFLNFCLKGRPCGHPYEDILGFSLITPIDDDSQFHRLTRTINEVKEKYSIARLLLFESYQSPYPTQFYDDLTTYADVLDFSTYGVRVAKLKLAYESAFNILDKIAFFINDYLGLSLNERHVNFGSIWSKVNFAPIVSPDVTIIQCRNRFLYGLFDVSRDLIARKDISGDLAYLTTTRNYLTHRYLVPHVFQDCDWFASSDSPEYHIGYGELLEQAITLMQLVRNAVIYLVAFIDYEERVKLQDGRRVADSGGWMHKASKGPQDSCI